MVDASLFFGPTLILVYYGETPKHEPKSRYGFKLWDIRGDREAEVALEPRARFQDRPLLPHRRRTVCLSPELEDHEAVAEGSLDNEIVQSLLQGDLTCLQSVVKDLIEHALKTKAEEERKGKASAKQPVNMAQPEAVVVNM